MKIKTLLAASVLVPSLALAAVQEPKTPHKPMSHDRFYAKVEAGAVWTDQLKGIATGAVGGQSATITFTAEKFKVAPVLGLGAGYAVNDFVRTDLVLAYRGLSQQNNNASPTYSYPLYLDSEVFCA